MPVRLGDSCVHGNGRVRIASRDLVLPDDRYRWARCRSAAASAAPAESTAPAGTRHRRERAAGFAFKPLQRHVSHSDIDRSAIRHDDRDLRLLSRHDDAIVGESLDPETGGRCQRVLEFALLLPQPEINLIPGRVVEVHGSKVAIELPDCRKAVDEGLDSGSVINRFEVLLCRLRGGRDRRQAVGERLRRTASGEARQAGHAGVDPVKE